MKITVEFDSLEELLELQMLVDAARAVKAPAVAEEPAIVAPTPTDKNVCHVCRDIPIDDMEITVRSYNCLKNFGLKTVGEVARCGAKKLSRAQNFGKRSLAEVRAVLLNDYGLELAP